MADTAEENRPIAERATYMTAKQTGVHLLDATGYRYVKFKAVEAKDRCYWICREQKLSSCLSHAITEISTNTIISTEPHNHDNRLLQMKVQTLEEAKVALAATMPTAKPRKVLGERKSSF
jgi:FLYWCH zinc finger domain